MSPNPKGGDEVHVPCRHCGVAMISTVARAGSTILTCPQCNERTRVQMDQVSGALEVRTAQAP